MPLEVRSTVRWAPLALAPVAAAYGLLAVGTAARHGDLTTYAGRSPTALVAELGSGWALLGVGLVAWWRRPGRAVGPLAVAAGFAWFAPDWIGWQAGPEAVRALALATQGVVVAAVVQIVLGATGGLSSRHGRLLVTATWASVVAIGAGRALLYDPLADPACAVWCAANPLLLRGDRTIARALDGVDLGVALLAVAGVIALGAGRAARAGAAARRNLWPVLVPAAAFLAAWAARAATLAFSPGDDPRRTVLTATFAVRTVALIALSAGLAWALSRASRGVLMVRRLARRHGGDAAAEPLETTLVRATGDATLRVLYPLDDEDRWIDSEGRPVVAPERRPDRALTAILRQGRPVAAVAHHPAVLDAPLLQREIGTAAQLGLDNERLRAQARARLRELQASRARIVEAGDAERRRLERDLHDGAQQRLVGLSVALRMAQAGLDGDRDRARAARLQEADDALHAAIVELRELAHGIHPVELSEEGLAAAVETLAERARVPLRIAGMPAERLPAAVETTAYVLIDDVVRRAAARGDGSIVAVASARPDGRLVIDLVDPGEASASAARADLLAAADRVSALGGRISIDVARPDGMRISAELPCA